MKFKAAIFDFDGTIMDTSPGIFATANAAIESLGLQPEEDRSILARFVGPPIRDSFVAVYNLEESLIGKAVERYRAIYDRTGRFGAELYEGIDRTLAALKDAGYRVAIATLKPEPLVKQMTDHFGLTSYFDSIRGSDPIHKTSKAAVIRHVLEDLQMKTEEAILIGDTSHDEEGAKEAGIAFIAVDWGFGFPKGYRPSSDAIAVAERPLDLLTFLL
ncbi:MAG TPA: HAD-IA family hydrolase [Sphaerochaeta sp.]|jgi:phosphoglycolate phosphatase|nr:HAD-IA family hydrolase [Spirochaetales bacterium]HPX28517.1 HAD-IA family hydrolase [Sphaerochaeta sp.]HQB54785.1 HAD-IA family hydrolase [Sphaerochaeta sp.]